MERQKQENKMQIIYGIFEGPLGKMVIGKTEKGICALDFGKSDAELEKIIKAEFPSDTLRRAEEKLRSEAEAVIEHLEGKRIKLDLALDILGTDFQKSVWRELRNIPYGQTRSYSDVARLIGRPQAVRAVARACATNPVPLIVPCHRVIRKNGDLAGFRGGIEYKIALLEKEAQVAKMK